MDDELYFKCEVCGKSFPADPDCMVSIKTNDYLCNKDGVFLEWEGSYVLGNRDIPEGSNIEQIFSPDELTNNAFCVCRACQHNTS